MYKKTFIISLAVMIASLTIVSVTLAQATSPSPTCPTGQTLSGENCVPLPPVAGQSGTTNPPAPHNQPNNPGPGSNGQQNYNQPGNMMPGQPSNYGSSTNNFQGQYIQTNPNGGSNQPGNMMPGQPGNNQGFNSTQPGGYAPQVTGPAGNSNTEQQIQSLQQQITQLMQMIKEMVGRGSMGGGQPGSAPGQIPKNNNQNTQGNQNGQGGTQVPNNNNGNQGRMPQQVFTCSFSTIKTGDSSKQVQSLQEILSIEGYFQGAPTGFFGSKTARSLKMYQEDNNLTTSGVVDTSTIEALNASAKEDFPPCSPNNQPENNQQQNPQAPNSATQNAPQLPLAPMQPIMNPVAPASSTDIQTKPSSYLMKPVANVISAISEATGNLFKMFK